MLASWNGTRDGVAPARGQARIARARGSRGQLELRRDVAGNVEAPDANVDHRPQAILPEDFQARTAPDAELSAPERKDVIG